MKITTRKQYDETRALADQLAAAIEGKGPAAVIHDARALLSKAWAALLMYEVAHGIRRA